MDLQFPLTRAKQVRANTIGHAWANRLTFLLFVGPTIVGLAIFVYIPIVWGLVLSFFSARYTVTPQHFIGVQNYIDLLQDPEFLHSLLAFTIFAIFIVPTTFILSLLLALGVNTIHFARSFFRSVFFLPTACSVVVASLIWKASIFSGIPSGFANVVLSWFHRDPIAWIGAPNPPWYWLVLVTVRLWLEVGFFMIIFLAGLQEIPRSLYEAAFVDGARTGWQTFRYITFPLLRNTSTLVLSLNLIWAFQAFDEFYNILGGALGGGANTSLARPPLLYLYQIAFQQQNYGAGTAGAFILTAVIICVTILQGRLFGFGRAVE